MTQRLLLLPELLLPLLLPSMAASAVACVLTLLLHNMVVTSKAAAEATAPAASLHKFLYVYHFSLPCWMLILSNLMLICSSSAQIVSPIQFSEEDSFGPCLHQFHRLPLRPGCLCESKGSPKQRLGLVQFDPENRRCATPCFVQGACTMGPTQW